MGDKELVDLIKNRPEVGMDQAMVIYAPFVKAIALKILGYEQIQDIQDCLSNTFIRLWKHIESFDGTKGSLKAYIGTIGRNEALRIREKSQKYVQDLTLEELELGIEVDMVGEVAREINKGIVKEVIDELEEPDHSIFIRRYFWGERIKSIGEALTLEDKFVENRLYGVKKKLKVKLLERGVIR